MADVEISAKSRVRKLRDTICWLSQLLCKSIRIPLHSLLLATSPPTSTVYRTQHNHNYFLANPVPGSPCMKFFQQSFLYDDPWSTVSFAFFLRYPNPYASHVLACDVISREFTPTGSLITTRLILKKGSLPRWAPQGIIKKAETWVIEETEVDPEGRAVRCVTKNLDHVKALRVEERITLQQTDDNKTLQQTEARFVSGFGWGLTKRIESHGLARFKAHMHRSREGISLIVGLIRQSRLQPMTLGGPSSLLDSHRSFTASESVRTEREEAINDGHKQSECLRNGEGGGVWTKLTSWLRFR